MPIKKLMKSILVLYDEKNKYEDQKVFGGKSALELCARAAASLEMPVKTISGLSSVGQLLEELSSICSQSQSQALVFAFADCPFLNKALVKELLITHFDYKAEYTFAEGYPQGFAPVVIDKGTLAILLELCKSSAAQQAAAKITRDCVFDLIKTDINSFEVETILAPLDWRLYRFAFDCRKKENLIACKRLYQLIEDDEKAASLDLFDYSAAALSEVAAKSPEILKTLPAFYNLQLAQKCRGKCSCCPYPQALKKEGLSAENAEGIMETSKVFALIEQISEYSGEAVIGLSAWGECFNHPDLLKIIEKILSYPGLSVFIEADGNSIPADFTQKAGQLVKNAAERTNGWQKFMLVISIDAFTAETCRKIRGADFDLALALDNVKKLEEALPGCIYPQFVRMNANESELESFFRYWKEKSNASAGDFIIQKHNNFAGLLPNEEPADLSPLERNPCWHVRRDMTILYNGNVPLCYCRLLEDIQGNVFEEGIEKVWKKIQEDKKCGGCDEFYTFNF